jgi:GcrA cell cycle regulator
MAQRVTNWKDEAIAARLAELWSAGHSCSTIARMLGNGATRNAVIGAVTRAGLPRRSPSPHRHNGRRSTKRKPTPAPAPSRVDKVRAIIADGLPIPTPAEFDVPRIATADLEQHHCRFPCVHDVREVKAQDPIFCGLKPVPGLPYCPVHSARAFQPPRPRPPAVAAPVIEKQLEAA